MVGGRRSRTGQTREQTREKLLLAGAEILREQPVGDPLEHVRVAEVARRCGLTHGSIYYHWQSQQEYRDALRDYVLQPEQRGLRDSWTRAAELADSGAEFVEVVRVGSSVALDALQRYTFFPIQLAVWGQRELEPAAKELLRRLYRDSENQVAETFREILERYGLAPRPPFTVEFLAMLMTALLEGLVLRAGVEPSALQVLDDELADWDALGLAICALLTAGTTSTREHDPPSMAAAAHDHVARAAS